MIEVQVDLSKYRKIGENKDFDYMWLESENDTNNPLLPDIEDHLPDLESAEQRVRLNKIIDEEKEN